MVLFTKILSQSTTSTDKVKEVPMLLVCKSSWNISYSNFILDFMSIFVKCFSDIIFQFRNYIYVNCVHRYANQSDIDIHFHQFRSHATHLSVRV